MASLTNALQQLRAERQVAQLHVEKLDQAISVIESLNGSETSRKTNQPKRIISEASRRKMAQAQRARWARAGKDSEPTTAVTVSAPVKRTMSASARKRISAAQKLRWAQARNGSKPAAAPASAPVKQKISAAGKKRIAAAQRARWAKLKAGRK